MADVLRLSEQYDETHLTARKGHRKKRAYGARRSIAY